MPKSTRSRKSKKHTYFGGSVMDSMSQTGSNVLNTMGNTADQAGTGIQKFFTDGYNKLFKKQSTSSYSPTSGGTRKRRGGYSFPKNLAMTGEPVNYKGGYSFPSNLAMTGQPVKYKGGKRSKRGGMYKAMSDANYSLATVPGTTAQPHHWVGDAQRWVGPSGNAANLH